MYMPSSYQSDGSVRDQIINDIYDDGRLNVGEAVHKVEGAPDHQHLMAFMESLETMDELFPRLPYVSNDDEVEYLSDVDYDVYHMIQALGETGDPVAEPHAEYYRSVPYHVHGEIMYSIEPVTKERLIKDLLAYQRNPDFFHHETELAPQGFAQAIEYKMEDKVFLAQEAINDSVDNMRVNLPNLYQLNHKIAMKYLL